MGDTAAAEAGADLGVATQAPTPNTTLVETGVTHLATRTAFLALFIIVGFVGNCVLLATIAQSHRLKNSALNLFVISAATVNLLDCAANMPLVLGSTITEKWDYGEFACKFNAFLILATSIEMCLSLTLMAIDRCLAMQDPSKYTKRLTVARTNVLIVYSWVHSVAFAFPLILGTVAVKPFAARYLCSVAENSSLLYITLTSLFGYIVPIILNILCYVWIVKICVQEWVKERQQSQTYRDSLVEQPRISAETNAAKYVGSLFFLWCILQGPYHLLNYIEEYRNSEQLNPSNSLKNFTYPWSVAFSFTWMKFAYPMFLPFATFFWRKEVWQKFKNLILCRKSIQINDASPKRSPAHRQLENGAIQSGKKDNDNSRGKLNIPVLFATANGLHVQTYNKKGKDVLNITEDTKSESFSQSNGSAVLTTRKCDVFGSRDLAQVDDDTSDYDSQIEEIVDPFSGSDPSGVRSPRNKESDKKRPRSLSVSFHEAGRGRGKSGREAVTSPSGVNPDTFVIESENNVHVKKNRKRHKKKKEEYVNPEVENEAEPTDIHDVSDESNDSGRGTVEKASRAKVAESGTQKEMDSGCVTEEVIKQIVDSSELQQQAMETEEAPVSYDSPRKSPKKKRKKKRMKEKPLEEPAASVELMTVPGNSGNNDEKLHVEAEGGYIPRKLPPRPHRLAPLEHRPASKLSNTDVDFSNLNGNQGLVEHSAKQLGKRTSAFIVDPVSHSDSSPLTEVQLSNHGNKQSNSNHSHSNKNSKAPEAITVAEAIAVVETNMDSVSVDSPDSLRQRRSNSEHHRTRTVSSGDSQTVLLAGSNTSSDLSVLGRVVARAATEEVEEIPVAIPKKKKKLTKHVKSGSQQALIAGNTTP